VFNNSAGLQPDYKAACSLLLFKSPLAKDKAALPKKLPPQTPASVLDQKNSCFYRVMHKAAVTG
jgi:hypothetical protein